MPGAKIGADTANPDIVTMVSHLDLEKYKATIKGLTQFGDRRQGTERNRAAVDWIEAQLKSYGCTPTERITYDFQPPPPRGRARRWRGRAALAAPSDIGAGRRRASRRCARATGREHRLARAARPELRALDTQQTRAGERQEVYCTKVGTTHPTRCTSSADTWTASAGARPRTTTARARRS